TVDVGSIVREWTPEERKLALAILISDTFAENGELPFGVRDENDASLAIVEPLRLQAREVNSDEETPFMKEMRRRVATCDESYAVDDVLQRMEKEEKESVFSPKVVQTPLSDGSQRWFDLDSARQWNGRMSSGPQRQNLYLSRCGTFIM